MGINYPLDARPSIQWNHIDGPLLCARNGQMHWLTWWERIECWLGRENEYSLEMRHFGKSLAHDAQEYKP